MSISDDPQFTAAVNGAKEAILEIADTWESIKANYDYVLAHLVKCRLRVEAGGGPCEFCERVRAICERNMGMWATADGE